MWEECRDEDPGRRGGWRYYIRSLPQSSFSAKFLHPERFQFRSLGPS